MSKTQILIHTVFGTKNRRPTLKLEIRKTIYKYIDGILNNLDCHLIRINGIEDHIHLLLEIPSTKALADIMKKVKQSSSHWINESHILPSFEAWGKGYFAVSISPTDKEQCRQYIMNQEHHHKSKTYIEEIKPMIEELGMAWYDEEWK